MIQLLLGILLFLSTSHVFAEQLALTGGKIYPSPTAKPIVNGVILIEDGKISAVGQENKIKIPPGATIIDCTGKTITAGFWNSHVHFTEKKWENAATLPAQQLMQQLQQIATRYGFTSIIDTGSYIINTNVLRKRIASGEVLGPRILTAGDPLYPPKGIPFYLRDSLSPDVLSQLGQPNTPAEATRLVTSEIDQGADIIKLFVVSWIERRKPKAMPMNIIQAASAEAHRRGKLVFAHPSTTEGIELALQGYVDVLAHTIEDPEGWTPSLTTRLTAAHVALIPTLTLMSHHDKLEKILEEVKKFSDAGGQILFGTDVGFLTDYNPTKEYELLSRAGLTFPQILASLTTAPASRLGFGTTSGIIEKGRDADLVILKNDPALDVKAFASVQYTLRKGHIIYKQ